MGITPRDLDSLSEGRKTYIGGVVPVVQTVECVAGTAQYVLSWGPTPRNYRVVGFEGIMRGAGAPGMTINLMRIRAGVGVAVTDVIPLGALPDMSWFAAATIDDTVWEASQSMGDFFVILTVGNPICSAMIGLLPVE